MRKQIRYSITVQSHLHNLDAFIFIERRRIEEKIRLFYLSKCPDRIVEYDARFVGLSDSPFIEHVVENLAGPLETLELRLDREHEP